MQGNDNKEVERRIRINMVVLEHSDALLYRTLLPMPPKTRAARLRYLAHIGALVECAVNNGNAGAVGGLLGTLAGQIPAAPRSETNNAANSSGGVESVSPASSQLDGIELEFGMELGAG